MSFTYTGTVDTDLEALRHAIGDTVAGAGVKPDGSNFSDEELALYIDPVIALSLTWRSAVPGVLRVLANLYAISARSEKFADYSVDYTNTAAGLRAQAAEWEASITATGGISSGGLQAGLLTYSGLYTSYGETGVLS